MTEPTPPEVSAPTPAASQPPPRPRWVKVMGIVLVVVVVLLVAFAIFGGGEHGPDRHVPGGGGPARHAP